jgi:hypothetical protein
MTPMLARYLKVIGDERVAERIDVDESERGEQGAGEEQHGRPVGRAACVCAAATAPVNSPMTAIGYRYSAEYRRR